MREADLQSKIIRYLKDKGCVVIKYQQNATTRASIPDIIFLIDGFWGAIEVKKNRTAPCRPHQKEMVEKLNNMSWAKLVYPENWQKTKEELEQIL